MLSDLMYGELIEGGKTGSGMDHLVGKDYAGLGWGSDNGNVTKRLTYSLGDGMNGSRWRAGYGGEGEGVIMPDFWFLARAIG